ncbi:MAG: hypothetical protein V4456_18875 [Bacteroidota bacterium]
MKTTSILKATIAALFLMVAGSTAAFAQCDKTVTLTSSKTNHLDESGNVERSKDETVVITITPTDITIVPGDEEHKMTGKITSKTCDWKVPFKEGKMVIKSLVSGDGNDEKDITLTIEGKNGKVVLTFEAVGMTRKIQVVADKFE